MTQKKNFFHTSLPRHIWVTPSELDSHILSQRQPLKLEHEPQVIYPWMEPRQPAKQKYLIFI